MLLNSAAFGQFHQWREAYVDMAAARLSHRADSSPSEPDTAEREVLCDTLTPSHKNPSETRVAKQSHQTRPRHSITGDTSRVKHTKSIADTHSGEKCLLACQ